MRVGLCKEGLGNTVFEQWMTQSSSPDELITRIRENFRLGGHKAAAIALVLKKAKIFLASEMNPELVQSIFMKPFNTVQEAYDNAVGELGNDSKVLVMPYGGSTLPILNSN
ncbi:MAG: hypothetical protein PHY91_05635 [Tissierellia bacterium]|nr:hypothetical protein [Tissierellia bacterium]